MMVHTPIQNKELLSTRELDICDPRHINAGLSNQEASRLHDKMGSLKIRIVAQFVHQTFNFLSQSVHIEFKLAGEIGNSETAAQIDGLKRPADLSNDGSCDAYRLAILRDQHSPIQDLRSYKQMNAAKIEPRPGVEHLNDRRERLFIDTEWGRFAAHSHGSALSVACGIDPDCNACSNPASRTNG